MEIPLDTTAPVPVPWLTDPLVLGLALLLLLAAVVPLFLVLRNQLRQIEGGRVELIEARGRFRALFEHMFDGALISLDGTVVDANPAAERLCGRPRDALLGMTLMELVEPEDREVVKGRVFSGDSTPETVNVSRPDGAPLPVEVRVGSVSLDGQPARLTTFRDLSIRLRLEDRMRRLATVDSISECLNRRAFLDQAEMEFERYRRYGRILSVLLVDVDDLRGINAKEGHQAGDAVLRHLVRRCDSLLRVSDAVGRYGGAECALLLPETPLAGAVNVGERLCAEVRENPALFRDQRIAYGVRVGVAEVRAADAAVINALERAEAAMRRAKREDHAVMVG